MFQNREDAARQLAARLVGQPLKQPVVLGIPRGGAVLAAVLARQLGAEFDVVLARKLRAPWQPELAIGALGEDGRVQLTDFAASVPGATRAYIDTEREHQAAEIRRRQALFRTVRPAVEVAGRSVIVTDDGLATGATMLAALHVLEAHTPHELIVAVPVAPPETLAHIAPHCDRVECLIAPPDMSAIGAYYADFTQVEDAEVVRLLREAAPAP
ncbi:phosphoribosyltransferase [Nitrogeniibacter mangrovi]|uniref:Phosphoribosyltransferase n=1 Tax=Nitrogeniibacter mangrovi TaxID=2016596 RepID=A0A6C1AZK5_9RHOO|nr:phosphoribosyltransferase family protein [Nitrogeniibacter mangrovi]QID16801.1 phosphoribosyltransferase [Nitrogeniibacter mangrovi]